MMSTPPGLGAEEEMDDQESESEAESPPRRVRRSASEWWMRAKDLIERGDWENVRKCLERCENLTTMYTTREGRTLLHACALHAGPNEGRISRILLNFGSRVDFKDKYGNTALYYACEQGAVRTLRHLLKAGASWSMVSLTGWSPLMAAAASGHQNIVTILLDEASGAKQEGREWLNSVNLWGRSAVGVAAEAGQCDVVAQLLAHGALPALPHVLDNTTPAEALRRRLPYVDAELQRRLHCASELLRHYEEELERGWLLAKARALSIPPPAPLPPPLEHRAAQQQSMPVLTLSHYEEDGGGDEHGKRQRRQRKRSWKEERHSPAGQREATAAVLRYVLGEGGLSQPLFQYLLTMLCGSASGRAVELLQLQCPPPEEREEEEEEGQGDGGEEKTLDTTDYATHHTQRDIQAQEEEEEEEEEEEAEEEGREEAEEEEEEEQGEEGEEQEAEGEGEEEAATEENEEATTLDSDSDMRMEEDDDEVEDSDESQDM